MKICYVNISIDADPNQRIKADARDGHAHIFIDSGTATPDIWFHAHDEGGVTGAQRLLALFEEMRAAMAEVVDAETQAAHATAAE